MNIDRYRVRPGDRTVLTRHRPGDTNALRDKDAAQERLLAGILHLEERLELLNAQNERALLLIFQGMDASGKDGAIKHVMSGVNPQGVQVFSFKAPSSEELDHDFLWRTSKSLPERGRIGVFNRSYYEEVLVVRVHPEYLQGEKLHPSLIKKDIWSERCEDIANLERYLTRNGIVVVKFFLHVSRKEQKKRFLERLDQPDKNWKFSSSDAKERGHWDEYMAAYEHAIQRTATPHAPWYVVPADNKWFTRLIVASAAIEALESLKLHYPKVGEAQKKELGKARALLTGQNGEGSGLV
jgi:PPK2 family polyphosphate:nucleotide phosphotransferase